MESLSCTYSTLSDAVFRFQHATVNSTMLLEMDAFMQELSAISGLNPTKIICVGSGYVREEIKTLCFEKGWSLTKDAVQFPEQIALRCVPNAQGKVLGDAARVELLKQLLKDPKVQAVFPILSQMRLRPRFFQRLDRTLQSGRECFAHLDEASVMNARLTERLGVSALREEYFLLNQFWEMALQAREVWDEPRLMGDAAHVLENTVSPTEVVAVSGLHVIVLEHFLLLPRRRNFYDALKRQAQVDLHGLGVGGLGAGGLGAGGLAVEEMKADQLANQASAVTIQIKSAHSIEDAARFCFDSLHDQEASMIIQDRPGTRRTLQRVAQQQGFLWADPRDPTEVKRAENIKSDLLDLELLARDFTLPLLLQWISLHSQWRDQATVLRTSLSEAGFVRGLKNMPPKCRALQEYLIKFSTPFTRRLSLQSLLDQWLKTSPVREPKFWTSFFEEWILDLQCVGLHHQKRPLWFWFEQMRDRLNQTRPLGKPARVKGGLALYRVDQAVSLTAVASSGAHVFGLDSSFFEGDQPSSEWFTDQERDILGVDFSIPGRQAMRAHREISFLKWVSAFQGPVTLWNYDFQERGGEVETLLPVLLDLQSRYPGLSITEGDPLGAHPDVYGKHAVQLEVRDSSFKIAAACAPDHRYSISFMDHYSDCPFTAFAGDRFKAYDEHEPDYEMKGSRFGDLLHRALEKMMRQNCTPTIAFEAAFQELGQMGKMGWLESPRMKRALAEKTIRLLTDFMEQEVEYQSRSGAKPMAFEEEAILQYECEGLTFVGRADRIDDHPDGLVVLDYKTQATSQLSNARTLLDHGQGLQLGLYGLAAQQKYQATVIGAHFISINKGVNRNYGIIFSRWNGSKIPGSLTLARKGNSLIEEAPETVWPRVEEWVRIAANKLKAADFSAVPANEIECGSCRYRLACGQSRRARGTLDSGEDTED